MRFTKMQSACNDFIVINSEEEKISAERMPELAAYLCRRRLSIGADGILFLSKPTKCADIRIAAYNAAGSKDIIRGNGIMCAAKFIFDRNTDNLKLMLETDAGKVQVSCKGGSNYCACFSRDEILMKTASGHYALWYDGLDRVREQTLWDMGLEIRKKKRVHSITFTEKKEGNAVFVKTLDTDTMEFIYSSMAGTIGVASLLESEGFDTSAGLRVDSAGGELYLETSRQCIQITGKAAMVYEGDIKWIGRKRQNCIMD